MTATINLDDESTMQAECRRLVAREVFLCVSNVVHCMASGYGNIVGEHAKPLRDAAEQASMLSMPVSDWESAATEAGWTGPHVDEFGATYFKDETDGATWVTANWEMLCSDMDIEPHEREVFEHWAVSDWLADKLEAQGETVDRDFAGLTVWARTTTGQAIMLDGVIRDIVRALHAA